MLCIIKVIRFFQVHMIGESGRGANLECLIAKYAAACGGQIVAMSATIGNAEELAHFLDGFHYHNSHRPVELKQYITFDKAVYEVKEIEGLDPVRMLRSVCFLRCLKNFVLY